MNQSIRFIFVGILNTIVGYTAFFIGIKTGLHYAIALFISHIIGILNSYYWNSKWTFRVQNRTWGQVFKFLAIYALTFLVNLGLLHLLVKSLGMHVMLGQFISLGVTTCMSFIGHKYWSFKIRKGREQLG